MINIWGWWTGEQIREAAGMLPLSDDPEEAERQRKRKEAEKMIEESGIGICLYCGQEIRRNELVANAGWIWESEDMIGWCDGSPAPKGNKHVPKI